MAVQRAQPPAEPSLIAVPRATLSDWSLLEFDLYVRYGSQGSAVLFRSRDLPETQSDIARLLEDDSLRLFVTADDYPLFQDRLRAELDNLVADQNRPLETRYAYLAHVSGEILRQTFAHADFGRLVEETSKLAGHIASLTAEGNLIGHDLHSLLRHDYCIFAHSFRVACYTALLAKHWAVMTDAVTLKRVAVGALLHDIGRINVPTTLLNKRTPLTDAERRVIALHPRDGFERLCRRKEFEWGQLMMAYQHHERIDGAGYPVRVDGREIHAWARLCSVANVFDHRVAPRPDLPAMSLADATQYLERQASTALDEEMVQCWVEMMQT